MGKTKITVEVSTGTLPEIQAMEGMLTLLETLLPEDTAARLRAIGWLEEVNIQHHNEVSEPSGD